MKLYIYAVDDGRFLGTFLHFTTMAVFYFSDEGVIGSKPPHHVLIKKERS